MPSCPECTRQLEDRGEHGYYCRYCDVSVSRQEARELDGDQSDILYAQYVENMRIKEASK